MNGELSYGRVCASVSQLGKPLVRRGVSAAEGGRHAIATMGVGIGQEIVLLIESV